MTTDLGMGTGVAVGEEGQEGVVLVGAVVVLTIVIDVIQIVDGLRDVGGVEVVAGVVRHLSGEVGGKAKGRLRRSGSDLWTIEMNEMNLFFACIFRTAVCDDIFSRCFTVYLCPSHSDFFLSDNGTARANVL